MIENTMGILLGSSGTGSTSRRAQLRSGASGPGDRAGMLYGSVPPLAPR
jgi:hypothetical protein